MKNNFNHDKIFQAVRKYFMNIKRRHIPEACQYRFMRRRLPAGYTHLNRQISRNIPVRVHEEAFTKDFLIVSYFTGGIL